MAIAEEDLVVATELCRLVGAPDLLAHLGLDMHAHPAEAEEALGRERKRMQAMQNNPKYRDAARLFLKKYQVLKRVVAEPAAHPQFAQRQREAEKIPVLALAIDSVLADGALSVEEERFVRRQAEGLGISEHTFELVLAERVAAAGLDLDTARQAGSTDARPVSGADGYAWWDAAFTTALLECIPTTPGRVVDIYCRTGLSARTLLPERPSLEWLGVDRDPTRVDAARRDFEGIPRVQFSVGQPHVLPVEDGSLDLVLGVRALANLRRVGPVLFEAGRALRAGGRVVLVEPDGYAESFLFDGHLYDYNAAFRNLCRRMDEVTAAGAPDYDRAGIALGPQLARRLDAHGFDVIKVSVQASYALKARRFDRFAQRLRRYPIAMAGSVGMSPEEPEVLDVLAEVELLEQQISPTAVGLAGHVLPMYLVVGIRDPEV